MWMQFPNIYFITNNSWNFDVQNICLLVNIFVIECCHSFVLCSMRRYADASISLKINEICNRKILHFLFIFETKVHIFQASLLHETCHMNFRKITSFIRLIHKLIQIEAIVITLSNSDIFWNSVRNLCTMSNMNVGKCFDLAKNVNSKSNDNCNLQLFALLNNRCVELISTILQSIRTLIVMIIW